MALHYCVICDNCNCWEVEYAPRAAFVIKPGEILKRFCDRPYYFKKYRDGTVLCQMCAKEFAGYQKDNADWFKEARRDKRERMSKTSWAEREVARVMSGQIDIVEVSVSG